MAEVFSPHAYRRFARRRLGCVVTPAIVDGVRHLAQESLNSGRLLTRQEGAERLGAWMRGSRWPEYYVTDGTGPGVWVVRQAGGRCIVLTYLAPGMGVRGMTRTGVCDLTPAMSPEPAAAAAITSWLSAVWGCAEAGT